MPQNGVTAPANDRTWKLRRGMYESEGKLLFVPVEQWWFLHEEGRPRAILKRAGLSPTAWRRWAEQFQDAKPWVLDYLYHDNVLDGTRIKSHLTRLAPRDGIFVADAAMKESSRGAVVQGARKRCAEVALPGFHLRKEYESHEWFLRWLFRGEQPPSNVYVATRDLIRHARTAFDYVAHCEAAGIRSRPRMSFGFHAGSFLTLVG